MIHIHECHAVDTHEVPRVKAIRVQLLCVETHYTYMDDCNQVSATSPSGWTLQSAAQLRFTD